MEEAQAGEVSSSITPVENENSPSDDNQKEQVTLLLSSSSINNNTNASSNTNNSIDTSSDANSSTAANNANNYIDPANVLNVNVGILGHVDSGKTSLVKALSTLLSTAALDKSKQSRERGMTLDLGFSCFFLDIPNEYIEIQKQQQQQNENHSNNSSNTNKKIASTNNTINNSNIKTKFQITLVDCPGHASLIRTIIGGAQIIDIVILVIDAQKGWQAQTTECLVLAELTSKQLIVVLNKIDQLQPASTREKQVQITRAKIQEKLKYTKFCTNNNNNNKKVPIIGVSACIGGQKVAAINVGEVNNTSGGDKKQSNVVETYNIDKLIRTIQSKLIPPPTRSIQQSSFYFAVDHCFSIKGRGTVLTGTCLSGCIHVNDIIEFPAYGRIERKIKSIQMFKKQVTKISEGDRAGICISNFDSTTFERGIIACPNTVQLWQHAIVLVRKVPYYPGTLACKSKFHISVGHTTVMAIVTFWGAQELFESQQQNVQAKDKHTSQYQQHQKEEDGDDKDALFLPKLIFDYNQEFIQQDVYLETIPSNNKNATPTNLSLSKDTAGHIENDHNMNIKSHQKQIPSNPPPPPLLHWALLEFQTPVYCPVHSLIIGSRLDTAATSSDSTNNASAVLDETTSSSSCRLAFSGRLIERIDVDKNDDTGVWKRKIRLYTSKQRVGFISKLGEPHRRQDDNKIVRYEVFGSDLFKKETNMKGFIGMKVRTEPSGDIGEIKSSYGTTGKFRVWFPSGTEKAKEGDSIIMEFRRFVHDPDKSKMYQNHIQLPSERPGTRLEPPATEKNKSKNSNNAAKKKLEPGVNKEGVIATIKDGDVVLDDGKHTMAIISGFFAPSINIKEKCGMKVRITSTKEIGIIVGPFGKAGKCKVTFQDGISANVGDKAELLLS